MRSFTFSWSFEHRSSRKGERSNRFIKKASLGQKVTPFLLRGLWQQKDYPFDCSSFEYGGRKRGNRVSNQEEMNVGFYKNLEFCELERKKEELSVSLRGRGHGRNSRVLGCLDFCEGERYGLVEGWPNGMFR
jgi:hypothetical protein